MGEQKANKVLIFLLVLFIITTFLFGGYIIFSRGKTANSDQKGSDINYNYNYNYDLTKRTMVQAVREGSIEIIVDTKGNAYLTLIGNLDYEENFQKSLINLKGKYNVYFPLNNPEEDGTLNAYKLEVEKVLMAYYVHMGNGGSSYFVFVRENGMLSYLSYDNLVNLGEVNIKNIDNLRGIVSVIENTYLMTPYAISLDGTEISLYDYIK